MALTSTFLKVDGKLVKNNYGKGNAIYLRGTNAGSLSVQENWMCTFKWTQNIKDQSDIWNVLTTRFGMENARKLIRRYMDCFWTSEDFDRCSQMGLNVIRLPIWYRDFVDSNGIWFSNGSDHSGVDGQDNKKDASQFFFGPQASFHQEKYYQMWEKIAEHFNGNPAIAGYDLLNEPFCTYRYNSDVKEVNLHKMLWDIYNIAYNRIRAIDKDHIIIMEATWDSWDLPNPSQYGWSNIIYEYHQYEFSHKNNEENKQILSLQNKIKNIFAMNYNVPSYMGEFNLFDNQQAWEQGLQMLNDNGIHWTTWTYKALVSNDNWGLYKYSGSKVDLESDSYEEIFSKWSEVQSSNENTYITSVLKKYVFLTQN